MSSIPLPALSVRAPEQPDIMGNVRNLYALKQMAQQQQLQGQQSQINQEQIKQQQLATQQAEQQQKDSEAFRAAMADPALKNKTIGEVADVLAQSGHISQAAWQGAKKADVDHRKELSELTEKDLKNRKEGHDATQILYNSAMNMPDDQLAANWPQIAQQYNAIPGNEKMPLDPNKPLTKQQLSQFAPVIDMGNAYFDQELARRTKITEGKTAEAEATMKAQEAALPPMERALKNQSALEYYAAKGDKTAQAALDKKIQVAKASRTVVDTGGPQDETPVDASSNSILAQTGLSMNAFRYLTGQASQLPRDKATRNKAAMEAQNWANKNGVDVSTLPSQFQSMNKVLGANIERMNNTKIMENELEGTIQNLRQVANEKDLGRLNIGNVFKIWAGQQVNDDLAQQYAMHLNQLRTELAAYNGATQGRTGNNVTVEDMHEAERTIKNGIAAGSLDGLEKAVQNSTAKMGKVMENSVDAARKGVWEIFGVGKNFKGKEQKQTSGGFDWDSKPKVQ